MLNKNIINSIDAKKELQVAGSELNEFYRSAGRLYIVGNGGSAADTQHLATEFLGKLAGDRAPLSAEALRVDTSVLTATENNYGYDQIFVQQVFRKMTERDIFFGIAKSGNSLNTFRALEAFRTKEIATIVFNGHDA